MTRLEARITGDPIDTGAMLGEVRSDRDGAVLLFLGTVRDHHEGRTVVDIRYEAYVEMAEVELQRIVEAVATETRVERVIAVHRIGELSVGEASIAVAVASPHRAEAYEASRRIMEEVKLRLPVWKDEGYADGGRSWVEGTDPTAVGELR